MGVIAAICDTADEVLQYYGGKSRRKSHHNGQQQHEQLLVHVAQAPAVYGFVYVHLIQWAKAVQRYDIFSFVGDYFSETVPLATLTT